MNLSGVAGKTRILPFAGTTLGVQLVELPQSVLALPSQVFVAAPVERLRHRMRRTTRLNSGPRRLGFRIEFGAIAKALQRFDLNLRKPHEEVSWIIAENSFFSPVEVRPVSWCVRRLGSCWRLAGSMYRPGSGLNPPQDERTEFIGPQGPTSGSRKFVINEWL